VTAPATSPAAPPAAPPAASPATSPATSPASVTTQKPLSSKPDEIVSKPQINALSENIAKINKLVEAYKLGKVDKKELEYYQKKYENNVPIMKIINKLLKN